MSGSRFHRIMVGTTILALTLPGAAPLPVQAQSQSQAGLRPIRPAMAK
ncbi:MAG: hypothetical protein HZY74_03040 [Brevundimonas sp.]|nr:MAG: hypothetical protein HZY74_03040 [Brevundimonas sp.]